MAYWLFKEEPDHYGFDKLLRDKRTVWDGVTNSLARQNLRQVRRGDRILFYHTGTEKAVVGEMRAIANAKPDPKGDDPQAVTVEVEAVRQLPHSVSLARIKADPALGNWDLVRLPRLSVMPVTDAQWVRIKELSQDEG